MFVLIDYATSSHLALDHVFPVSEHPNDCVGARVGDGIYSAESLPVSVPPLTAFVFEALG